MNIFILNAGRCGSTTFIKACGHITNYTSSHESRANLTGEMRTSYPENHIEADNRLSWLLGRIDQKFGNTAYYVHLVRGREDSITSFVKRSHFGIMKAYKEGILLGGNNQKPEQIAEDYLDTIDANISLFLKDKPLKSVFRLAQAQSDFKNFWNQINAQGNLDMALKEWQVHHNASAQI
ncbi:MAG: hypothetical protein ABW170_01475 [Candidatus Thiodiazotropha sp. L084R]